MLIDLKLKNKIKWKAKQKKWIVLVGFLKK